MVADNSPGPAVDSPAHPSRSFRNLLVKVFRQTQEFFEAKTLPHVANRACAAYLGKVGQAYQTQCRQFLQSRLEFNPSQLRHFLQTSLGRDFLAWLHPILDHPQQPQSQQTFQDVLLDMATEPGGISLLSCLRRFPHLIQATPAQFLWITQQVEWLIQASKTAVTVIQQLARSEAESGQSMDFARFTDLRQAGPFAVQPLQLQFEWADRTSQLVCYAPQPWPDTPTPVIVQSHGLASSPADMAAYAGHLAAYGYFVVTPQHPGSDAVHVRQMLVGEQEEVFDIAEFIERPLQIQQLLNELERRNATEFDQHLNLQRVGMMGSSFGAYTALALAGADLHFDQLTPACALPQRPANLSLLLQCQALGLPRQAYQFRDPRVQAVFTLDAVGSELFGPEGIAQIQVPVLLLAGDRDTTAPLVLEQIRLFDWLNCPSSYLALLRGRSHIQNMEHLVEALDLQIQLATPPVLTPTHSPFEDYIKALSVAFFMQHLGRTAPGIPPLGAAYATFLSSPPFDLWLVSQASRIQLRQKLEKR